MFKKLVATISSLAIGVGLLTGCTPKDNNVSKELDQVTIAEVTHSVFYAPQYAAITKGFFEEEGIKVDLLNTQGADKTMAALISGEAQVGLMGPEASVYVYNQGSKDYAINFAQLTKRDGSFLVGREKLDNFKYEDLKGSEILGGRKGGMPLMTFEYVLKQHGLNVVNDAKGGDVNVRTDVQFGTMTGAFVAGESDYVTAFEPTATQMEKEGSGYIIASIGEDSGEIPYTAYSTTKAMMEKDPDLIQRFTNAVYRGQLWVQSATSEEIAEAMQPFFEDIAMEDLVSVVNRYRSIDAWSSDPILKEESLNKLMDVMEEAGELEKKADYNSIVNTDFAKDAIKNIK